ncbi:MAG: hypothetical protein R3C27_15920 [Hyphomonadaceae bacterium]
MRRTLLNGQYALRICIEYSLGEFRPRRIATASEVKDTLGSGIMLREALRQNAAGDRQI